MLGLHGLIKSSFILLRSSSCNKIIRMVESKEETKDKGVAPQSVRKNFSFQTIYQIIILVLPFFTAPYLTRHLGPTALGNFNYVNSNASYFGLVAALGISAYGLRAIASVRNDSIALRKTFWSLYLCHVVSSFLAFTAYLCFALFSIENRNLYLIETLSIFSIVFDITWLFSGLENFQSVVLKNLFIKAISVALIFILIKTPEDIGVYTWIQGGSSLLSNLLLIPWALKHVKPIRITFRDCVVHIKPMLILFLSSVATSLYTTFDKTLLGLEATKEDVAYYHYAETIIAIPKALMGSLITVLNPRICALFAASKREEAKKYLFISLHFVSLLGMGTMFGLLGIGQNLAIVFYGSDFAETGTMLLWMSPLPYIILIGQIAIFEFMVPAKLDKIITINICIAAVVNVSLSAILIRFIGPTGAILGTIVAESLVTILDVYFSRTLLSFKDILFVLIPYAIFGGIMLAYLFILNKYWSASVWQVLVSVITGGVIYLVLSAVFVFFVSKDKNEFRNFAKEIIKRK